MARRKHVHTPARLPSCPTPTKRAYARKADGKKALSRVQGHPDRDTMTVYRCDCGAFHIGHKRGTLYKKLKKAGELREQQEQP